MACDKIAASRQPLLERRSNERFGFILFQLKLVLDEFVGVRRKMENKVGAVFSTAGDASGGKETTMMSIIQALLIYGMIIVGDPMSATGHYGTACVGAPDVTTRENGQRLASGWRSSSINFDGK